MESFFNAPARVSQLLLSQRPDSGSAFKESAAASPKSLFKSTALMSGAADQSHVNDLDMSVVDMQTSDFGEMSNYPRLEHHNRHAEELKKIIPRFSCATVPLQESLMKEKIHIYSDAGLFQNRRCRVGWAPDLKLVQLVSDSTLSIATLQTSNFAPNQNSVNGLNSLVHYPIVDLHILLLFFFFFKSILVF